MSSKALSRDSSALAPLRRKTAAPPSPKQSEEAEEEECRLHFGLMVETQSIIGKKVQSLEASLTQDSVRMTSRIFEN